MKYILDNKSDSIKSITETDVDGLKVTSKSDNVIGAKSALIVDEKLKRMYIKQKLNQKITLILAQMQYILESDDAGETNIAPVLDEIEKLKGILINKYYEHLKIVEYHAFLKKITMLEEEFQTKYSIKQIYKEMLMENFNEDKSKGR